MAIEKITAINLNRILWCCQDLGITLSDLASELKINHKTLEDTAKKGLSYNQLQKIADFFGRGVLFFLSENDVIEEHAHSAQFRTVANRKHNVSRKVRTLIELAERKRELYLSLLNDIDAEKNDFFPPELVQNEVNEFYKAVHSWLDLPTQRSFDTYRSAIEKKGILVIRSNGYNGAWQVPRNSDIMGFSLYFEKLPVIFVRKCDYPARQVFTLFHELGHLLLHKSSYMDDQLDLQQNSGIEQETNDFAGNILLPKEILSEISNTSIPENFDDFAEWLMPWTKPLGISIDVILLRLIHNGSISSSIYGQYKDWLDQKLKNKKTKETIPRSYRDREPLHLFGDGFVRTVIDAKNMRKISLSKASDYLDKLNLTDMKKLEQHLETFA